MSDRDSTAGGSSGRIARWAGVVARWLGYTGREEATPPGIQELVESYCDDIELTDPTVGLKYPNARRQFQKSVGGTIAESRYSRCPRAGVVLVDKLNRPWVWRHSYCLYSYYDSTQAPAALDDVVRKARSEERRWRLLLHGRSQEIIVQATFGFLVSMLSYLEFARKQKNQPKRNGARSEDTERVSTMAESMREELEEIRALALEFSRRNTLQWYLLGMLPGIVIAWATARYAIGSEYRLGAAPLNAFLTPCVVCGAVGAIVSVMVRISNDQKVQVAPGRGRALSLCTGAFRPLIGAILASALYILSAGGIVPIAAPTLPDGKEALFYAGLAFLAGFSERWAQDTIVSSTSRLGSESSTPDHSAIGSEEQPDAPTTDTRIEMDGAARTIAAPMNRGSRGHSSRRPRTSSTFVRTTRR